MSEDVEIRVVLDTSAMLSYARGHVHVGEILIDIAAEDGVALPAVALLDAYARSARAEPAGARLGVLAALPGVLTLTLGPKQAAEVSPAVSIAGGDLARAHPA